MDPFTQRMLERARARQEKIDQKLASTGQTPKRRPLVENTLLKSETPAKSTRSPVLSPKKSIKEVVKSESPIRSPVRKSVHKTEQADSPQRQNDFIVTKKEYKTPKRISNSKRNSDVSVEINIMHRDDIQIEVQVEERDAPMTVVYDSASNSRSNVVIKEIQEDTSKKMITDSSSEHHAERSGLRHNVKSQLDRLGVLYSDNRDLSSPIHRTELEFSSATPPDRDTPRPARAQAAGEGKRKFGRLAALADQINNWEDDLTHHGHTQPPATKKPAKPWKPEKAADQSTLDVSIHSLHDINKALKATSKESSKPINSRTYTKPTNIESQALYKNIVAELEGQGYRRVSAGQSRLVYDFTTNAPDPARQEPSESTPSAAAAPDMAAAIAAHPPLAKKPSIKKYRAPTPPKQLENCDKENNLLQREENDNDDATDDTCVQTNEAEGKAPEKGSPVVKRIAPKLNGNVDRNSVLSRAAMFEAGSPRTKEKDPAEMSLRERKALFEKNKGAAIIPKAPFGLAPSAKALHGETKADPKPAKPVVSNSRSKENIPEDHTSQNGGIKGKLAALFNKEQTISESTIANKFKQEREREMEMLQNRFHFKPKPDSDDEHSDNDPSEVAPLMGSTLSLNQAAKKPEICAKKPDNQARKPDNQARKPDNHRKTDSNVPEVIAAAPKVQFDKAQSVTELRDERRDIVAAQPGKRRSSQDSPVVLSVLEEVKRIKVNDKRSQSNGVQPSLYPHLSDIETDTSHTQEEYSDCGGSSEDIASDPRNKSDNWAETSFGREVMNVVKKNNSSYKKAVRETDSETSNSDMNSELDDMLDEALNDEDSEGPTPPKLNKHATSLSSKSFTYEDGQVKKHFKSPLKMAPATPRDKGSELVHSVSFYRRTQNAGSQPGTPHRVVRHASPERGGCGAGGEPSPAPATTVRQRIQELQAEINKQQTVISQASQALNLCAATVEFSGSTEQAEGERLLLLATHRRQACLHEIQRLQVEGAGAGAAAGMASLHVSGLSVPLRRDYIRKLNADGAVGHHAVCLLKCRDRVLASSMRRTSPAAAALTFPDDIRMEGIASDFKVTIEVYLLQASEEKLPHDVKYHIFSKKSTSKLLTPKSKVSELKTPRPQSPAGPLAVRSPQFQPHGYCIFALQQASRSAFTLNKVPAGSPLDGSVSINIRCVLRVPPPPPHAAFLTAFDDVSGLGAWHRRWFRLQAPTLAYWRYPDDVTKKLPIGDIDLSGVTSERVTRAPRDLCARPNTLLMESVVPPGLIVPESDSLVYFRKPDGTVVRRHLLAADTQQDRDSWLDSLNRALEYVRCCEANGE